MRRKIEKYLAKKQGCDEANIRYTDDGRFDFMGDLEGVLSAVRGKENLGKTKRSDRKSRKSSTKKKKYDVSKMPPMGMPPPYMPYGLPPMSYPGMPPHPGMYHPDMPMAPYGYGKPMVKQPNISSSSKTSSDNNIPLAPKPSTDELATAFSPRKGYKSGAAAHHYLQDNSSTPGPVSLEHSGRSSYFSSSRKSIFDSPRNFGDGMLHGSPALNMNINGMTPLSTLKGTFATPYSSELFSELSLEDNLSLNKALFADEDKYSKTPVSKTPQSKSSAGHAPREMKLNFCGSDDSMTSFISDMRYNRVSISPVSHKSKTKRGMEQAVKTPPRSVSKSIHFADEERDDVLGSVSKINSMMPTVTATSEAQTPMNVTNITQDSADKRDVAGPSPFNASLTPIGNYDESFWGRQLGFSPQEASLTPFKSPSLPSSIKKRRTPLASLAVNTLHAKSPSSLRKSSIRKLVDIKADPEGSPAAKRQRTVEATPTKD
eukprot:scaffold991_cov128-Cylindrotheca_fusiformis.AAC.14